MTIGYVYYLRKLAFNLWQQVCYFQCRIGCSFKYHNLHSRTNILIKVAKRQANLKAALLPMKKGPLINTSLSSSSTPSFHFFQTEI